MKCLRLFFVLAFLAGAQETLNNDSVVKMVKAGGQESIDELRTRILADKALDFVYRNAVIQG